MKIAIQITCESPDEAMNVMAKLTAGSVAMQIKRDFIPSTPAELDRYMGVKPDRDAEGVKPLVFNKIMTITGSGGGDRDAEGAAPAHDNYSSNSDMDKPRANVNPGEPIIGKIGTATKNLLMSDISVGRQPPQPKYTEHLKLLWKRKEICFDGTEYYLPG